MMVSRWNLPIRLTSDWFRGSRAHLVQATPMADGGSITPRALAAHWCEQLLGGPLAGERMGIIEGVAAEHLPVDQTLDLGDIEMVQRIQRVVTAIAMSPEFQVR